MDEIAFFKKKIEQSRFVEAACLAELISLKNEKSQKRWEEMNTFLMNHHFKLLSFSNQFNWADRVRRNFKNLSDNLLEQDIELEKFRLNKILELADTEFEQRFILECYKGYYALINQDGLRAIVQLYRSVNMIENIEKNLFASMKPYLKFIINQNIGFDENNLIEINKNYPFSLYVEFDKFLHQSSKLLNTDIMNSFEIFKPHLILDARTYLN
ncbi:MAG: hypothetical protein Q8M15_04780 [Bacteroidota bacterium]|nr:hypothetical protein [Bacteroidota bacterium]